MNIEYVIIGSVFTLISIIWVKSTVDHFRFRRNRFRVK